MISIYLNACTNGGELFKYIYLETFVWFGSSTHKTSTDTVFFFSPCVCSDVKPWTLGVCGDTELNAFLSTEAEPFLEWKNFARVTPDKQNTLYDIISGK